MKNSSIIKNTVLSAAVLFMAMVVGVVPANAANVPNLTLTAPSAGSDAVQVMVYGADPNVSVLLYHPSATSYVSTNIGTTNQTGYFMSTVNSISAGIAAQAPVYVMVGGQQSMIKNWPSYTSTGGLPLSQTNVIVTAGQSTTVSASVSAALTISNNSNSYVASATINGNQIIIAGQNQGTSNISICSNSIGCSTINVTVLASSSVAPASISLSQSNLNMTVGQSQSVILSGSGSYYVSNNTSPGVVNYSLNGSSVTINAVAQGTAAVTVCSSGNNSSSCGLINVTVTASNAVNNANVVANDKMVTFSPSSVNLSVGQRQTVAIYGSGNYYVSNNSNSSSVTASVNGTNVDLTGIAFGGTNIQICQIAGGCGNLYVYVAPNNTLPTTAEVQSSGVPTLSSVSVSSAGGNGFYGAGAVLTVTFSVNQAVNIPTVSVAGNTISATGSGNGPYTAKYTMKGDESQPVSFNINFTNLSGTGGQAYISVGATAAKLTTTTTTNTASVIDSLGQFTTTLSSGSTGAQVTALQKRLTTLGFYSGPITGKFGAQTEAAVKKYQTKHGLSPVGVVGPGTRSLLNQGK